MNSAYSVNSRKSKIEDCRIIQFPKIEDRRGSITPLHQLVDVPFEIKRIFYIYDIPGGKSRGAHAHIYCHQIILAASGSFGIKLDDGINRKELTLNQPYYGIHVSPGIWASEVNFSSGAICLTLTSHLYNENDYIRNYETFLKFKTLADNS